MTTQQLERTTGVIQLPSGADKLVFEAEYPGIDPAELFTFWTEPDLLTRWWPQEAEIEPHIGGDVSSLLASNGLAPQGHLPGI